MVQTDARHSAKIALATAARAMYMLFLATRLTRIHTVMLSFRNFKGTHGTFASLDGR